MVEKVISTCEIDCQTQNIENVKHELSPIATKSVLFNETYFHCTSIKKSLKIPKYLSEAIIRRRTDNTMAKSNRTKGQAKKCYPQAKHQP
jgi:hypothetical protein